MSYYNGPPTVITTGLSAYIDGSNYKSYPDDLTSVFYYGQDLTDNGFNLTLAGSMQTGNRMVDGVKCYNIDPGTGQGGLYKPSGDANQLNWGNDYTVVSWARIRTSSAAYRILVSCRDGVNQSHQIIHTPPSSDVLNYFGTSGNVSYGLNLSTIGTIGKWAMYAAVGSGGTTTTAYVYRNGTRNVSSAISANATGKTFYTWGNNYTGVTPTQVFGNVCSLFVYNNVAMTTNDLDSLYEKTRSRFSA